MGEEDKQEQRKKVIKVWTHHQSVLTNPLPPQLSPPALFYHCPSPSLSSQISSPVPQNSHLTYTMSADTTMTTATPTGKTSLEILAEVTEAAARFPMPTWGTLEDDDDTQPLIPWTSPMEIWVDTQVEVARDYYPTPPHSTPIHTPSCPQMPTLGWGDETLGRTPEPSVQRTEQKEDPEVPFQQEKKKK